MRRSSADVLAVLAARPGEIVKREESIETVWKAVATADDTLIRRISDICRALGNDIIGPCPEVGHLLAVKKEEDKLVQKVSERSSEALRIFG